MFSLDTHVSLQLIPGIYCLVQTMHSRAHVCELSGAVTRHDILMTLRNFVDSA